ncbi:GAF domain-containing sensor histidine kinase [Candidatus Curtissbacteria bacterium]|nr:GAF domain-containing sensor histidine kinase [Candidatus Curtissbacteria bacterium]
MFKKLDFKLSQASVEGDDSSRALLVSHELNQIILESLDFEDVVQKIADTIPNQLKFATGVVAIIDTEKGTIRRVAASRTKEAIEAIKALSVPFKNIEIPLSYTDNLIARAVAERHAFVTDTVFDVMDPVLNEEESAKIQGIMGTKTTFVFPIFASHDRAIGVFIASTGKEISEITQYERDMVQIFIDGVGVAIEHALLYSKLKNISDELAVANNRLKQLDQLKDEFVSVASHELRTPMTAIKSFLWMALNKQKENMTPDLKRYLDKAYTSTERLINLVNDMLNISRIEGGRIALKLEMVDIVALTTDVVEELQPKATEKGVRLEIAKANVPNVLCDKDKIHEVLLNLMGNSLKFTPKDGTVSVVFRKEAEVLDIAVSDTGRGIAPEDMNKLFTKFGRLDNSYVAVAESGGTGLGLYISKSLVEIHKGKIWAESDGLDHGATFTFTLPIFGTGLAENLKKDAPKETSDTKELEKTKVNI